MVRRMPACWSGAAAPPAPVLHHPALQTPARAHLGQHLDLSLRLATCADLGPSCYHSPRLYSLGRWLGAPGPAGRLRAGGQQRRVLIPLGVIRHPRVRPRFKSLHSLTGPQPHGVLPLLRLGCRVRVHPKAHDSQRAPAARSSDQQNERRSCAIWHDGVSCPLQPLICLLWHCNRASVLRARHVMRHSSCASSPMHLTLPRLCIKAYVSHMHTLSRQHVLAPDDHAHGEDTLSRQHVLAPDDHAHGEDTLSRQHVLAPDDHAHGEDTLSRQHVLAPDDHAHGEDTLSRQHVLAPDDHAHVGGYP